MLPLANAPTQSAMAILAGRAKRWTGILAAFFSAQAITQILGLGAGLVLVRFMPVREFALYTLATSFLTFFTFFTDLGMTGSLSYFYRRSGQASTPFAPYMGAVMSLRRAAFWLGAMAVAIILPLSARDQGFSAFSGALATTAVLIAVWFQIEASVAVHVLRLLNRFNRSYRAEIFGSALRLTGSIALALSKLLVGWLGVLMSAAAAALTSRLAHSQEISAAGTWQDTAAQRREVLRFLLPTLPSALYFSIQSPLVIWLAATFGKTDNIAQVGALGRLGLIVGLFSTLTGIVLVPRLVQIHDDRTFFRRVLQFSALLLTIAVCMLAAARLMPQAFLWLLGASYAGLETELQLVVGTAALNLLGGYFVAVNMARSWNRWQTISVFTLAVCQAFLAATVPLSTTSGVLTFGVLSAAAGLLIQLTTTAVGFVAPAIVHWD